MKSELSTQSFQFVIESNSFSQNVCDLELRRCLMIKSLVENLPLPQCCCVLCHTRAVSLLTDLCIRHSTKSSVAKSRRRYGPKPSF